MRRPDKCLCSWEYYTPTHGFILKYRYANCPAEREGLHK